MLSLLQCLYESFEEGTGCFQFATAITSNDIGEIQKFLGKSVEARYSVTASDVSNLPDVMCCGIYKIICIGNYICMRHLSRNALPGNKLVIYSIINPSWLQL